MPILITTLKHAYLYLYLYLYLYPYLYLIQHELLTHIKGILKSYDVSLGQGPRGGRNVSDSLMSLFNNSDSSNTITKPSSLSLSLPLSSSQGGSDNFNPTDMNKERAKKTKTKTKRISAFFARSSVQSGGKDQVVTLGASESQLILALQVLASPDFFSRQPTKNTSTNANAKRSRAASQQQVIDGVGDKRERALGAGAAVIESTGSTMLLRVVREAVVRYLDDYNNHIRAAAVTTCASVRACAFVGLVI